MPLTEITLILPEPFETKDTDNEGLPLLDQSASRVSIWKTWSKIVTIT